jgi:hypothetical protein
MSTVCGAVRIKLKRGCERASASASRPLETCTSPGDWWSDSSRNSPAIKLVQAPVLLQRERVVQARHEQDVLDAERHQVLEPLIRIDGIRVRRQQSRLGHRPAIVRP